MNWFTRLLRRKPKVLYLKDMEGISVERDLIFDTGHGRDRAPRAAADIIGRQGDQRRNRVHIYRQPLGYPIRLCDSITVDVGSIEVIGETKAVVGPLTNEELSKLMFWAESTKNAVICKHCQAMVHGKREPSHTWSSVT